MNDRKRNQEEMAATSVSTLGLILIGSVFLASVSYASDPASYNDPSWWSNVVLPTQTTTNNGHVTTNNPPNYNALANQGQLKFFTARAVAELNSALPGGAGPALNSLVSNWQRNYQIGQYATNSASPYNPNDYQLVNVGQLKYIGNLVWGQMVSAQYVNAVPSWLSHTSSSDYRAATVGQLKTLFNFDFSSPGVTGLTESANTNGTINLGWTAPAVASGSQLEVEQQNPDGSWSLVASLGPTQNSYAVSNLAPGQMPAFRIIASHGNNFSQPVSTPAHTIAAPSNVQAVNGAATGEIDLSWVNNATNATSNLIEESSDGVNWKVISTVNASATSFAVTGLIVGQSYYFGVAASNN